MKAPRVVFLSGFRIWTRNWNRTSTARMPAHDQILIEGQSSCNRTIWKLNSCFTKKALKVPCVVFHQDSESGLGIEIGHRQPECRRAPELSSRANLAVQNRGNFAPNYALVSLGYGKVWQEICLWTLRTHAPLWWTNNEFWLVFLQCTILHSCAFGQNSHTTTYSWLNFASS